MPESLPNVTRPAWTSMAGIALLNVATKSCARRIFKRPWYFPAIEEELSNTITKASTLGAYAAGSMGCVGFTMGVYVLLAQPVTSPNASIIRNANAVRLPLGITFSLREWNPCGWKGVRRPVETSIGLSLGISGRDLTISATRWQCPRASMTCKPYSRYGPWKIG